MTRLTRTCATTVCAAAFLLIGLTSAFTQDASKPGQTQPNTRIIRLPGGQPRPTAQPAGEPQMQMDPTKRFERLEALARQQGEEIEALKKENTGLKIRLAVVEPGLVDAGKRIDKVSQDINQTGAALMGLQARVTKYYDEYVNHAHELPAIHMKTDNDGSTVRSYILVTNNPTDKPFGYWMKQVRTTSLPRPRSELLPSQ